MKVTRHELRRTMGILAIPGGHHPGGDDDAPPPAALALAVPPKRARQERVLQVACLVPFRTRPWAGPPAPLGRVA